MFSAFFGLFIAMAIQNGGLFGRPSGKLGGVVFGAARGREGKLVTAREFVKPSNPNTAGQVLQRSKFAQALTATRKLTASLWQDFFNRAISQLPGFQSMMSIITSNTDASELFVLPPDTPLGNLHFPDTLTVVTGTGGVGTYQVDWSDELGLNGTLTDIIHLFAVNVASFGSNNRAAKYSPTGDTRDDDQAIGGAPNANVAIIVGVFFEGQGTSEGILSPVKYYEVTSHA